jgi:hypothetical protein
MEAKRLVKQQDIAMGKTWATADLQQLLFQKGKALKN